MHGEPELMVDVLRRRAGQLRDQAADVRHTADALVAQTEALGWTGRAAASMRERVQERATHLRRAAEEHDLAAESLEKHAQETEVVADQVAQVERRATTLVAEARTRLARVAAARESPDHPDHPDLVPPAPDPDDEALDAFEPPPSGHPDWLAVELPGL